MRERLQRRYARVGSIRSLRSVESVDADRLPTRASGGIKRGESKMSDTDSASDAGGKGVLRGCEESFMFVYLTMGCMRPLNCTLYDTKSLVASDQRDCCYIDFSICRHHSRQSY